MGGLSLEDCGNERGRRNIRHSGGGDNRRVLHSGASFAVTSALTFIGLLLFGACWIDAAVQAAEHPKRKRGALAALQRVLCAVKGRYKSDVRVKLLGVAAVLCLIIGQASSAFAEDDPAWCANGERGCSDYWRMQAEARDDTYGEQLAKVIKAADGNVAVLELLVWGGVTAFGLAQVKHISRDITRVQLAKAGKELAE